MLQLADNSMLSPLPGLHHDPLLPRMTSCCSLHYLVFIMRSSTCSSSPTSGSKRAVALMVYFNSWITSCCPLYYLVIIMCHLCKLAYYLLFTPLPGLLHALLLLDWSLPLMTVVPLWSLFAFEMLTPLLGHHHALHLNCWLTTSCALLYLILILLSTACTSSLLVFMWMACPR